MSLSVLRISKRNWTSESRLHALFTISALCSRCEKVEFGALVTRAFTVFWDNRDNMLARGISRACTATVPRAFATSAAPASALPREVDSKWDEMLMKPTLDERAFSKSARNVNAEVRSSISRILFMQFKFSLRLSEFAVWYTCLNGNVTSG